MPLVTFEGVEGCGKTTQLRLAGERLREAGRDVVVTREPGGTAVGERLRDILMDSGNVHLDPITEWLLLEADRRQHVGEMLVPALSRGAFVLCDRYADATEAYQGAGRGIDLAAIASVDELARGGLRPEMTLLYDLDPREGLTRARSRDGERTGRFESADLAFHERVRRAYLAIAAREPGRVTVISAAASPERVFLDTWRLLGVRFGL
ncbi:MAG TPA: dTMP kinase [Thermoanaerobaculia bacterium]|nr:dTMP kinase [Thermoanaerobaculia bacterium]